MIKINIKYAIIGSKGIKMNGENEMPLTFQMALAHNKTSMNAFLRMNNETQDKIINEAKEIKTVREMHKFVNFIPKMH